MVSLSSNAAALAAIERAHRVLFAAYSLRKGPVLDALSDAAKRGARVTVRLEGRPYGDGGGMAKANRHVAAALRRLGADAALVDAAGPRSPMLHMKAAVCDGVAYLDDRNWTKGGTDTIVRDDAPSHARAIAAAVRHHAAPPSRSFWTSKKDSLAGEARLLYGARNAKTVDVESESFGPPGGAYAPLKQLAQLGVRCRLIVASRHVKPQEAHDLDLLRKAGVQVRLGDFNEKMGAGRWFPRVDRFGEFQLRDVQRRRRRLGIANARARHRQCSGITLQRAVEGCKTAFGINVARLGIIRCGFQTFCGNPNGYRFAPPGGHIMNLRSTPSRGPVHRGILGRRCAWWAYMPCRS